MERFRDEARVTKYSWRWNLDDNGTEGKLRTPDNCGYRATFDINGVYIYIYIYAWNRFVTHSSDSLERLSRSSDANNPCTLNVMNTGIIERVWIYLAGCYLPMRTFDFCGFLTHRMSHKFPRFPNVFPISFPFRVVTACRYYYLGKRSKKKKKWLILMMRSVVF